LVPEESGQSEPATPSSIDALGAQLVPVESSASGKIARQLLAHFLELDDASSGSPTYPTQSEVAERTHRTRAQIGQVLAKARERWRRTPALTGVRNDLADFLTAEGGVADINELTQFLLTSRGSDAEEPLSRRRAAAVVRAAIEAERPSDTNRFEERRSNGRFLVARSEAPFGEAAFDYAERLGAAARQLASADPLPSPARVQETLRAIPSPVPAIRDARLVRLAAVVGQVAVSPRLELYPKGLDASRALKLAQSAVAGLNRITPEELKARVRERYPDATALPNPPDLNDMVRDAGLALTWQDGESAYVAPALPATASSISLHRQETVVSASATVPLIEVPREIEEALQFERRLQAAYRSPSYLVLAVEPRLCHLHAAEKNISRHFPMKVFHCEREMLAALHTAAGQVNVRWEVILRADAAGPETRDSINLRKLAEKAAAKVADQLLHRGERTLVVFPGLLGRYGQFGILDQLQDSLGAHSLWVLAGSEGRGNPPMSEKQVIPARRSQWAWIPEKWLDNEFRKYRLSAGSRS
jgi:hypothetical protein